MTELKCSFCLFQSTEKLVDNPAISDPAIIPDNEPKCGYIHPAEELQEYRTWSGIADAKLIVCAMCITDFNIADPEDANVMNMPGFDTNSPKVMSTFIMDEMQPRLAN